jgi:uncharacterized protein YjbI with pentapeptide repeats
MNRRYLVEILAAGTWVVALDVVRPADTSQAAERQSLTTSQVRAILKAAPGHANFKGKYLFSLDLGGLDFHGANFDHSDLTETKFTGANLAHASFVDAFLSATRFPDANLRGARMTGATLLTTAEGANFTGADLSHTSGYLIAPRATFVHATLVGAKLNPELSNQPMGLLHTIFSDADLSDANLAGADLQFSNVSSAKFLRADLRNVRFDQADLSRADFTGANVAGASFAKADIAQTVFAGVHGRSSMRGLDSARNREQAIFGRA